jgi:hypothetical protein
MSDNGSPEAPRSGGEGPAPQGNAPTPLSQGNGNAEPSEAAPPSGEPVVLPTYTAEEFGKLLQEVPAEQSDKVWPNEVVQKLCHTVMMLSQKSDAAAKKALLYGRMLAGISIAVRMGNLQANPPAGQISIPSAAMQRVRINEKTKLEVEQFPDGIIFSWKMEPPKDILIAGRIPRFRPPPKGG